MVAKLFLVFSLKCVYLLKIRISEKEVHQVPLPAANNLWENQDLFI